MASKVSLGILISGSGTNLQAIIDSIEAGLINATIKVVISNREKAYGLERARKHGLAIEIVDHQKYVKREEYDRILIDILKERGVDLVILAGFMRLLSALFTQSYANRIMNIHPSLLPAFPGLHVQKKAIDHGVRFSGCTVHFVNDKCDGGPIIIQAVVPVFPDDDEKSLAARILKEEHLIYPKAIQLYCEGRLHVDDRKVMVDRLEKDKDRTLILPSLDR